MRLRTVLRVEEILNLLLKFYISKGMPKIKQ